MSQTDKDDKKKCPDCGSHRTKALGAGHHTGTSQPMESDSIKMAYECPDCGRLFSIWEKNPYPQR